MIWITTILGIIKKSSIVILDMIKSFFKWDSEQGKWLSPVKTFVILGIIAYIVYMHSCSELNCPPITSTSDTQVVTVIDTIPFVQKPTTTQGSKPVAVGTGVPADPEVTATSKCDSIFEYAQEYNDSLIEGTLNAKVKGELLSSSLTYTPKFPKYIIKTETITITNNNTIEVPGPRPYGLILGGGVNVAHNQTFGATIDIGAQFKQGFDVIYRFDPLRMNHSVGVTHTFEFKKRKKK